jgi:methylphosphotriester-DNA--protein-cysteine methyltransferase
VRWYDRFRLSYGDGAEWLAARGVDELLGLLEGALRARAARAAEPATAGLARRALRLIAESPTPVRVDALAEDLAVSPRHFRRAFRAAVGLGPKEYARVVRFQGAVRAAESGTSWTRVAADAVY